jgi:hypothetical protein
VKLKVKLFWIWENHPEYHLYRVTGGWLFGGWEEQLTREALPIAKLDALIEEIKAIHPGTTVKWV